MVRCTECKQSIMAHTKYQDWLGLFDFLCFLRSENYIELTTYEDMLDKLLTLKVFAFEEGKEEGGD